MGRRLLFRALMFPRTAALSTLLALVPAVAHASETAVDRVAVTLSAGFGELRNDHTDQDFYDPHAALQLAVDARVAPNLAIGAVVGDWPSVVDNQSSLWRFGVETRSYAIRGDVAGLWGGGEIGLGIAKLRPLACGDCGALPPNQLAQRLGFVAGVGGGADLYLARWLSIGFETRFLGLWFDANAPTHGPGPNGLTHAVFVGVNAGGHFGAPG
jgi:hypothetical protein